MKKQLISPKLFWSDKFSSYGNQKHGPNIHCFRSQLLTPFPSSSFLLCSKSKKTTREELGEKLHERSGKSIWAPVRGPKVELKRQIHCWFGFTQPTENTAVIGWVSSDKSNLKNYTKYQLLSLPPLPDFWWWTFCWGPTKTRLASSRCHKSGNLKDKSCL